MKARTRNRRKRRLTREDRIDIAAAKARRHETAIPFEQVVNRLKKIGLL